MKVKDLFESEETLYHVTLTKSISKIGKKGILPMQTSNWVKAGDKSRYGGGYIFAFTSLKDAYRWAMKWDWSLSSKMGSGKVSIIEFTDDSSKWEVDDADPMSQAMNTGKWLKRVGNIPASSIKKIIPVTPEDIKKVVIK